MSERFVFGALVAPASSVPFDATSRSVGTDSGLGIFTITGPLGTDSRGNQQ